MSSWLFHRVRFLRQFSRDTEAVSATEFALILPFMVALLLGSIEISTAVALGRKVELTAHTVTDLVTQYSSITAGDMTNILSAAAAVLAPYSSTPVVITVTEVTTDANSNATVAWSTSLNGTALTTGSAVTLPTTLRQPNATFIWGVAQYTYTPNVGYKLTGPIVITEQTYLSPRLSVTITYPAPG
jgi:Flp pilus assembly protein TadG